MLMKLLLGDRAPKVGPTDDAGHRTLTPALVGYGDDRRLLHFRVRHKRILERDRRDPLATALDQVFGAIGNFHIAVGLHGGHVTSAEPTIRRVRGWAAFVIEIFGGDPRPARHK